MLTFNRFAGSSIILSCALISACDRTIDPAKIGQVTGQENSKPNGDPSSALVDNDPQNLISRQDKNAEPEEMPVGESSDSKRPNANPRIPEQSASEQSASEQSVTEQSPPTNEKTVAIEVRKSNDPSLMVQYLAEIDRSIEQLLLVQKQMEPEAVRKNGIMLAKTKFQAAKHLSSLPSATAEQQQLSVKAQLVALSHLSGLKDVQAAKQLEELAKELLRSQDGELKQQAQVVLFGFAIQNLQNGVISDPQQIVVASQALVADERYRGRLEMTSLQHAMNALAQLGYHEQISQLQRISFDVFSGSTDQPLRQESWNRLVANSPSQLEFLSSLEPLGTASFNHQVALDAARKLIADFPNPVTLEMLATTVPNIEYAGQAEFAVELAKLIEGELAKFPTTVSAQTIQGVLTEHHLRRQWIGRSFEMLEVFDTDGQALKLAELSGKVVLVSFGLTTDLNCMKELAFIEKAYEELHKDGFEILYVSMDPDLVQLQKFAKQNTKPWKIYRTATGDARPMTQHFGITMFPHMMLVDRDGKVAGLHVRGERIIPQAKELLVK